MSPNVKNSKYHNCLCPTKIQVKRKINWEVERRTRERGLRQHFWEMCHFHSYMGLTQNDKSQVLLIFIETLYNNRMKWVSCEGQFFIFAEESNWRMNEREGWGEGNKEKEEGKGCGKESRTWGSRERCSQFSRGYSTGLLHLTHGEIKGRLMGKDIKEKLKTLRRFLAMQTPALI